MSPFVPRLVSHLGFPDSMSGGHTIYLCSLGSHFTCLRSSTPGSAGSAGLTGTSRRRRSCLSIFAGDLRTKARAVSLPGQRSLHWTQLIFSSRERGSTRDLQTEERGAASSPKQEAREGRRGPQSAGWNWRSEPGLGTQDKSVSCKGGGSSSPSQGDTGWVWVSREGLSRAGFTAEWVGVDHQGRCSLAWTGSGLRSHKPCSATHTHTESKPRSAAGL